MRLPTTFIIILFSVAGIYAQNSWVGLKLGLSHTNILSDESVDYQSNLAFQFGLTYEYDKHQKYSVGIDFMYAERGAEIIESTTTENGVSYQYFLFPINFNFNKSVNESFKVFTGFSLINGLLINSKGQIINDTTNELEYYSTSDLTRKYDLGVGIRLGIHWHPSPLLRISPFISYDRSLLNHRMSLDQQVVSVGIGNGRSPNRKHTRFSYGVMISTNL